MIPLRLGGNLTSTFARSAAAKRLGSQLVRRSYVGTATAPARRSNLLLYVGLAGAGIGLHAYGPNNVYCDNPAPQPSPAVATPPPVPKDSDLPPPPSSALNLYELTFGSVCGICAGVFIKKGAKFVAFMLGGTFVLLQYLGSLSIVRVDWSRAATRFENLFYRTEGGVRRPPTIGSIWNWLVSFLAADFQPRATFAAGLILGLRGVLFLSDWRVLPRRRSSPPPPVWDSRTPSFGHNPISAVTAVCVPLNMEFMARGLIVKTSTPNVDVNGVGNIKVTTTLTNTGHDTLKILNDPSSVLSTYPTNAFTITGPTGSFPSFVGVMFKYLPEAAAAVDDPSYFTVLVPGASIDITHDLSAAYDFTSSGPGEHYIEPANRFIHVDASGTLHDFYADVEDGVKINLSGNLVVSRAH